MAKKKKVDYVSREEFEELEARVSALEEGTGEESGEVDITLEELEEMGVKELRKFAEENDIELPKSKKKQDILDAIIEELGLDEDEEDDDEDDEEELYDDEEDDEDDDEDEDEEDDDEDDEDEDEDDEDDEVTEEEVREELEEMKLKELVAIAKDRDLSILKDKKFKKANDKKKKAMLVDVLTELVMEEENDEDEVLDIDSMSLEQLKEVAKDFDIKVTKKDTKKTLIKKIQKVAQQDDED